MGILEAKLAEVGPTCPEFNHDWLAGYFITWLPEFHHAFIIPRYIRRHQRSTLRMEQQPIIAILSLACQRHFGELGNTLDSTNGDKFQNELSSAEIEDELGRFRLWASNIGALSAGKASLDYRLRDAEYLFQNVKSLLQNLKESLSKGFIAH